MKMYASLACLLACLFFTVGCEKNQTEVSEIIITEKTSTAKGPSEKIDLCHKGEIKNVSENALASHLAHGDVQLIDDDNDGYVTQANDCGLPVDCDDSNAAINPGTLEIPYNGIDDDCNPATPDDDLDGDGFVLAEECDDTNAAINPGAVEIPYNGIDDDCNPLTPDDDLDGDGFLLAEECDDTNAAINPDAVEICDDRIDNNCNGLIDGEDTLCATCTTCSACEVIPQELLDMIIPTDVPGATALQILSVTVDIEYTRYVLQVNTYGYYIPSYAGFAQMRIELIQFTRNQPTYNYVINGEYFNPSGEYISYIPGISGTVNDGNFESCAQRLLDYAVQYDLPIE